MELLSITQTFNLGGAGAGGGSRTRNIAAFNDNIPQIPITKRQIEKRH